MTTRMIGAVLLGLLWMMAGIAPAQAGTKHYYYTDAQGTVLAKADAQGNIVATYDYAPYGSQVLGTPPNGPAGYTGHVNDAESGFVYMQQRYYDPRVGRFLSVDPVGIEAGGLFSFNRYNYANNNSLKYIDPNGLASILIGPKVDAIAVGGFTLGAGFYISYDSAAGFDVGVYGSAGGGIGADVGIGIDVGYIPGPSENITGQTLDINGGFAVVEGTASVSVDGTPSGSVGVSVGLPASISMTTTQTGHFGYQDVKKLVKKIGDYFNDQDSDQ